MSGSPSDGAEATTYRPLGSAPKMTAIARQVATRIPSLNHRWRRRDLIHKVEGSLSGGAGPHPSEKTLHERLGSGARAGDATIFVDMAKEINRLSHPKPATFRWPSVVMM